LDYGYFSAVKLLLPRCRASKVKWLLNEYERVFTGILQTLVNDLKTVADKLGEYLKSLA
jgi:hypothetical protein